MKSHEVLKKALDRQIRRNPGYSLRALARAVGASPSYMSRVLAGKRPISGPRLESVMRALSIDDSTRALLERSILQETANRKTHARAALDELLSRKPEAAAPSIENYEERALSEFNALDPWYRIAITELTTCTDFESSSSEIAKRLGLTEKQVQDSLEDLARSGILKKVDGRWTKTSIKMRFPTTRSHPAIRRHQQRMMERAIQHLMTETSDRAFDARTISSITLAANPRNLKKARKLLTEALYEVTELLTQGDCTEVYQLNLQLFPLTQKRNSDRV